MAKHHDFLLPARPAIGKIRSAPGDKIWVESQPGQGSTFAFTLPVHVEQQGGADMSKRMLVVEDQASKFGVVKAISAARMADDNCIRKSLSLSQTQSDWPEAANRLNLLLDERAL